MYMQKKLYLVHIELAGIQIWGQEQDVGMGLVPFYSTQLNVKSLAPSKVNEHGKLESTVQETSAKVYGIWCIPSYSTMY